MWQTVRFIGPGVSVVGRANMRRFTSGSAVGTAKVYLYVRAINYSGTIGCSGYQITHDQNSPNRPGAWVLKASRSAALTTTWQTFGTTTSYVIPGTYDGVDLQLRIASDMRTSSGTYYLVGVDAARATQ